MEFKNGWVELSDPEIRFAFKQAEGNQQAKRRRGFRNTSGLREDAANNLLTDQVGACGEMAFAKLHGVAWEGRAHEFDRERPDVDRWEVRTSQHIHRGLHAKPKKGNGGGHDWKVRDRQWASIRVIEFPTQYHCAGWAFGHEVFDAPLYHLSVYRPKVHFLSDNLHHDFVPWRDNLRPETKGYRPDAYLGKPRDGNEAVEWILDDRTPDDVRDHLRAIIYQREAIGRFF